MSALLVLAFAAPAHAVPRALARSAGVLAIAPGGDQVLVAQTRGANLRVVSIPLAGGAARQVFSFDVPSGLVPVSASLSASAQRAALILEMGPGPGQPEAVQTFAGPLAGGWVTLQPFTRTSNPGAVSPVRQQADGDRLFTTESRGEDTRVVVRDRLRTRWRSPRARPSTWRGSPVTSSPRTSAASRSGAGSWSATGGRES